ncbi:hypothetical protein ASD02_10340 [Ensifer sp. Root1252]|nr:hypothetical protein ASD00_04555 [Ensifer sp. Root31]KQW50324.1 hypothetical protein ASD02_10340 [Ensifer sp. Root1252]KRC74548.1 hypothetical protein ASE32_06425 [Ensifer sp. Root231]KRC94634.1 hypothetical protein ASE47_07415 [Ensifer sp. Root258]
MFVWLKGLGIFNVISFNGHLGPKPLHNFVDHTWVYQILGNHDQSRRQCTETKRCTESVDLQPERKRIKTLAVPEGDRSDFYDQSSAAPSKNPTLTFKITNRIGVGIMNLMDLATHPNLKIDYRSIAQKKSITNVATNERNKRQERPFADRRHSGLTSGSQWRQKTASCLLQTPPAEILP